MAARWEDDLQDDALDDFDPSSLEEELSDELDAGSDVELVETDGDLDDLWFDDEPEPGMGDDPANEWD